MGLAWKLAFAPGGQMVTQVDAIVATTLVQHVAKLVVEGAAQCQFAWPFARMTQGCMTGERAVRHHVIQTLGESECQTWLDTHCLYICDMNYFLVSPWIRIMQH
jgi:hypothetical protein